MSDSIGHVAAAARRAATRIDAFICNTPLAQSPLFSSKTGADVYLKLENLQHTGSFKLRGATNRLMTLSAAQRGDGCVTASSGNHGAAVACAMQKLEVHGVIFVPERTSPVKIEAIRSFDGDVRLFGSDGLETEQHAREFAERNSMVYLSPYNDAEVIAGQATCGIEIVEQLPDVDAVFIAVGGGGLASGVGSVLRTHNPNIKIYGCQPQASAIMAHSIEAGRIVDLPSEPTLSDGTAGGIEADAITFELCRELIDEFILVSEEEIANAMRLFINAHDQVIEGAAGVAIAAMLARAEHIADKKVAVVVCGGNVSQETLESIRIKS